MRGPIVCGVDGSERGARALSTASWLADRMGASLVAVHVIPKPSKRAARAFGSLAHASDAAKERGNRVLARALDRPDLPKSVGRLVEVGNPAERLISTALDSSEQSDRAVAVAVDPGTTLVELAGREHAAMIVAAGGRLHPSDKSGTARRSGSNPSLDRVAAQRED